MSVAVTVVQLLSLALDISVAIPSVCLYSYVM